MGWPKSLLYFLHEIRHIFYFTDNYWFGYFEYVGYLPLLPSSGWRPGVLINIFQYIIQPHSKELFGQNVNSTKKFHKPLLNMFDRSQHLLHTLYKSVFTFQFCSYLLWNNKSIICWKCHVFSSIFNIKMDAQKITNF